MAKASTAAPRATSNLPINYQEQLAKESAAIASRIGAPGGGDRIKSKGNQFFILPDGSEADELELVIVDFLSHNLFYDRVFDPKTPFPPACFAIGAEPTTLAPSKNSPSAQADTCTACPNNMFNSDPKGGKGKACKNTRLLAVLPGSAIDDDKVDLDLWTLSIPPAAMSFFDGYVRTLAAKHKTAPTGVITKVTLAAGSEYFSPRFEVVRPLKVSELGTFMRRREEARARLEQEPDVTQYEPPAPRGRPAPAGKVKR